MANIVAGTCEPPQPRVNGTLYVPHRVLRASADDGALIWFKDNSGTRTADAVAALNDCQQNVWDAGIVEWLSGPLLTPMFQDPATDSRAGQP